jgi:hypothetical protein
MVNVAADSWLWLGLYTFADEDSADMACLNSGLEIKAVTSALSSYAVCCAHCYHYALNALPMRDVSLPCVCAV